MLLATASYASLPCHASNSSSSGNSNSKTQKLTRTTNQSSQKNSTAVATTTAALMKTIAVRANRHGGFTNDASVQKTQQQQQQSSSSTSSSSHNKTNSNSNSNSHINDNLKKTVNATAANSTNNYNNSKNTTKNTTANVKSAASTTTASSSSSAPAALKATIPTASFLKTYTVPPTALHRSSKARLRSCSIDSLHDEMCHFKPIRSLPLTPLKSGTHSRGFSLKAPKPNVCTSSKNCDFSAIKRVVIDRENQRGKLKPTRRNETRLSSSIFQNMKPHLSAFVRLQPNASIDLQEMFAGYTSPTPMKSQKANSKTKIQRTTKSKKVNAANNKTEPNAPQRGKSAATAATVTTLEATIATVANKNSTNSRKRKAQTNLKQNEIIETKKYKKVADKTKNSYINRKTPPLTRGRSRLVGKDAQLIGPLV